ncbi:MAG: HAMP domain-containing protein [Catenulispora sp.]|nr:HAMP domain-containing protein [Catenulispora sp.]
MRRVSRIGTARNRLAAGYAALVLLTAAALIVGFNLLLEHNLRTSGPHGRGLVGSARAGGPRPDPATESRFFELTRDQILRDQWVVSGLTIGGLTLVSVAVGWLAAGRVLRPLHRITAAARRLSLSNLHERIALTGPRDELTELADTFDSMLDRLQHAAEAQRRFVANASHELRTPLAVQRTAIQVGLERPSPERLAAVRAELLTLNRRSERLIDGLLVLAQSENGMSAADPIALHEVARQVVRETPPSRVTIRAELAPVTVLGDPALVNRLVANLVENAVKYNVPGGTVDVQTTADGLLSVRNTGPRIPPEQVSSLFEPFRRIPPRTRAAQAGEAGPGRPAVTSRPDGAGLGLSIVAAIVRAHGADLEAQAGEDGGLHVRVRLPLTRPTRSPTPTPQRLRPTAA